MVKWTSELDAKLFTCIMKVYDVKITGTKLNQVAEMMGDDITAKALTHRLSKIKGSTSTPDAGSLDQDPSSASTATPTKNKSSASNKSTPAKPTPNKGTPNKSTPGKGTPASAQKGKGQGQRQGQRSRDTFSDQDDEEEDVLPFCTATGTGGNAGGDEKPVRKGKGETAKYGKGRGKREREGETVVLSDGEDAATYQGGGEKDRVEEHFAKRVKVEDCDDDDEY